MRRKKKQKCKWLFFFFPILSVFSIFPGNTAKYCVGLGVVCISRVCFFSCSKDLVGAGVAMC